MQYATEDDLRKQLRKSQRGTLTELAKRIGVNLNFLSMVMNGAPVTGKIVRFLGYEKVRERLYRPTKNGSGTK